MSIYTKIYYTLCNNRKQLKESYKRFSGLHRHHIIPKHSGGNDAEENVTYLTVREHIIAHFLLWKIHRNPLDIGAMHMLGAKISPDQRSLLGKWCALNNIGIHSDAYKNNKQLQSLRCKNSAATQKHLKVGTFSKSGRTALAICGGKVGGNVQYTNKQGIHNPLNFKKNASLGGKALRGMLCVTNGQHRTRIRPERLDEFLANGYTLGFTLSS